MGKLIYRSCPLSAAIFFFSWKRGARAVGARQIGECIDNSSRENAFKQGSCGLSKRNRLVPYLYIIAEAYILFRAPLFWRTLVYGGKKLLVAAVGTIPCFTGESYQPCHHKLAECPAFSKSKLFCVDFTYIKKSHENHVL